MLLHTILALFTLLAISLSYAAATLSPPPSTPTPPPSAVATTSKAKLLSRKRRYVAFPEGSSVSAALCMTIGVIGNPNVAYLSWAINWGVAYNLPNYTWAIQAAHGFKNDIRQSQPVVQRRSRRDLYEKIKVAIESMGFNGHACIARALCESSKYLRPSGTRRGNMIEEIVKTIFSLPTHAVYSHEPDDIHQYDHIYRRAKREVHDCSAEYPQCHFSLLELALGKYSVEPTKHGTPTMPLHTFM